MDEIIILVLFIIAMVEMMIISNLSTRVVNSEEKIDMLEFEKRSEYMRGVREGIDMGKGYSERVVDYNADE